MITHNQGLTLNRGSFATLGLREVFEKKRPLLLEVSVVFFQT